MTEQPVFSARDVETLTLGERSYVIAPLTFRERVAFRAAMTREAGEFPSDASMYLVLRAAVREAAPENLDEVLAVIDAAENAPADDLVAKGRCAAVEQYVATVPSYATMMVGRQRFMSMLPFVAAQHALRGWDGPNEHFRFTELVPEAVLEELSDLGHLEAIGWAASRLMQPGRAARGNSALPSPSPASRKPATGASSRKTAAAGGSPGKNTKPTPG